MKTVFIGALPFRASEKSIRELVDPYGLSGPIELHADWHNPTFEPYALVPLAKPDQAVEELDGRKIGATHLRVHVWVKNG